MKNSNTIKIAIVFLLAITLSIISTGCNRKKGDGGGGSNNATPTPTPAPGGVVTYDVKSIVSTGSSMSFNNLTGGVNSVAVNPVSKLPAVAYYDKNANISNTTAVGALKYAYMDSAGAWNIEVVDANYGTAACGSANSYCIGAPNTAASNTGQLISLAFKADGTPAIAYAYGASANTVGGFKQIRLAEKSISGVWSIATGFQATTAAGATNVATATTIEPLKGVKLGIDSSNRPHIIFSFYTQTISNSKIKYIFRDSNNVWSGNDITAAVSGSGTITATAQGANQQGLFMCNGELPVMTGFNVSAAAGVGKPIYANCTATTNGGCSTWNVINMTNGCSGSSCFSSTLTNSSNAGTNTSIHIDSNNVPLIGIYSTTTPNTSLYTLSMPNTCDTNPSTTAGSWGTPNLVGSSSDGANGFALTTTATEAVILYLRGTTSVMINKCTISSCSYFTTGTTIDTTTVNREGVDIFYDATNDTLFTTHARLPAAAAGAIGNDLIFGTGSPADISNAGSMGFSLTIIDNMVNVFPNTNVPLLSANMAPNGLVGYAYFYQDVTAADQKLYFGIRGGPINNPAFSDHVVTSHQDSGTYPNSVGVYPSLIFDSNSNPLIAYYNGVNKSLELARSGNKGTTFSVNVIDDHTTNDLGQYPNLARYNNSIGIAYYDITNTSLKFAANSAVGDWRLFQVDGVTGSGCGNDAANAGKFADLAFTSDGKPVIAYQSDTYLRLAVSANDINSSTHTWTCLTLDSSGNNRGVGIGLAIGPNNSVHIIHFDATAGQIRYVSCNSNATTCIADSNLFSTELIEAIGTTSQNGTIPKIKVTSTGKVYTTYYSASYQTLVLSSKEASGSWVNEYIEQTPSGSSYVSAAGLFGALYLNQNEQPGVFYRSNENWIKYFSREVQ